MKPMETLDEGEAAVMVAFLTLGQALYAERNEMPPAPPSLLAAMELVIRSAPVDVLRGLRDKIEPMQDQVCDFAKSLGAAKN
jgi:hypothetical protein